MWTANTYYKAWDFCKLFCNYSFSTIYLWYNFNLMIRVPSFSLSLALSRIRTSNCVTSNINKEKLPLSHKWKGLNYKSFVFWNKSRQFWNVFGQFWNIFRQLWNTVKLTNQLYAKKTRENNLNQIINPKTTTREG